jgi:polyisoprenoid-binding protein YceI
MQREPYTSAFHLLVSAILIALLLSCAQKQDLAGKWQEVGKQSTIEFRTDGTFKAIDDMGMAVIGNYTLESNNTIRFEIAHEGTSPEIVYGTMNAHGDELNFNGNDDKKVERYTRVRQ